MAVKRLLEFVQDSWREGQKVVWPTRKETLQATLLVFVFVVLLAIFLFGVDWALSSLIDGFILSKGK
jgi:preprotein translocase subunit SecE